MARKGRSVKHKIQPDFKYNSDLVSRVVNSVLRKGKKAVAAGIVYEAMDILQQKINNTDPLSALKQAVDNVKPLLEVKSRRVGGANYQIPVEVRPERGIALAIRWILISARSRPEKTMVERLALELFDAYNKTGLSVKKREDTHKMAEANKAFAHYRW